ncbi:MAG: nucleotide disphospho-sugar-binding domain-containing protein, partial [Gemmatimonadota bacterium]
ELVLALGDRSEPADLGELPAGVHAFARAPQLEILARADAAIVHGGINTIDECVLAGVPMLTSCGGETDMAGNTVRVVHHGIGLAADPERDTTGRILDRLDRLLGDLSIAGNLSRMGALYRAYSEEEVAQRAVDRLLFGGRGPSP